MRIGPTVEQLGFGKNPSLMLASLARLFYLAAIRPDKSRGPEGPGALLIGLNPAMRQGQRRNRAGVVLETRRNLSYACRYHSAGPNGPPHGRIASSAGSN